MEILKNKFYLSILLLLTSSCCMAQVYRIGAYSGGTSYYSLCSHVFAFPPYKYKLTELQWSEDADGLTIMDVNRKKTPGDVLRRSMRVECGSETFVVPLDSVAPNKGESSTGLPVMKGSGDLAQVVTQCATNRGGHVNTNGLPAIEAKWIRHSRALQDIIVVDGDRFAEVQNLLEQASGKPDPAISSPEPAMDGSRWLTYTPDQIGVLLNLTGTRTHTIVSIIEKREP
jgi:hypothetical protein